ncbi:MAG: hypothetical protein BHW39_02755 [Firmicutes bacterium CAG:552_39_19]|nr:MAG: hypothetical protein BHW39_02755 [Firmicutes bacterium CAG:552_39_19]
MVPLQACAGWEETVNSNAHPRILLPQNRCLPEPLAAPFPHQPEPRCNTLDFASKVVCQRGAAAPLETQDVFDYSRRNKTLQSFINRVGVFLLDM